MNTKTTLKLTMTENNLFVSPYFKHQVEIEENNERKTKTNNVEVCRIPMNKNNTITYTSLCVACAEKYAPLIVFQALKTVYAKAPHDSILRLMYDCMNYAKTSNASREEFENYLASDGNILKYMSNGTTAIEKEKQLANAENYRAQNIKVHEFKYIEDIDGKKHKVEVIPYVELKDTKFSSIASEVKTANDTNLEDLIQTAITATLELVNLGLVHNTFEFWNYRGYIYKCVNDTIKSERKRKIKETDIEPYTIKNANKGNSKQIEKIEKTISREQLHKTLENLILKKANKRINKDMLVATFNMYYVNNKSTRYIADELKVNQTQVMRYIEYVRKIIATDEIKALIMEIA